MWDIRGSAWDTPGLVYMAESLGFMVQGVGVVECLGPRVQEGLHEVGVG